MQFNKVLWTLIFVFMVGCWQSALTARLHQKGRSAAVRIFPLHQRKLTNHGRSSAAGSMFDTAPATAANNGEEGRGLMKKFMLFKSLFYQEKSEPSNNIIIITQPARTDTPTTTTQPTTTGTTGTGTGTSTTTAAATPTGTNTGRDSKTELDENDDIVKELKNSQAQEIVQELITQTKPKRKRLNKLTKFNANNLQNENQKPRKRRIRLSKRKQLRKRLPPQQTQTQSQQQQHQQQTNTINVENLLNNMNLTKRPNQHAKHNSNNNHNEEESNNSNKNHNNNASGILNLNTNMRLQNIMNAFRKQTPIMYNY